MVAERSPGALHRRTFTLSFLFPDDDLPHPLVQRRSSNSMSASDVRVGDTVLVNKKYKAVVRFIGPTAFKSGIWYGVELEREKGKHNGTVSTRHPLRCWPWDCSHTGLHCCVGVSTSVHCYLLLAHLPHRTMRLLAAL